MANFGSDFDPTVPADASPRRDGAKWIRDIKTRLKSFASVYFDLESGKFRPGVLPSSVLVPTNAAGTWTKGIFNAQGQLIQGFNPTTAAGLGITDVFDANSILGIANGGTGLSAVPAGGRRVLVGTPTLGTAWYQVLDSPSIVFTFDDSGQTISAAYNNPATTPQPQILAFSGTYDPSLFNGRITLVPHTIAGPNGLPAVLTLLGVKIAVGAAAWTGFQGLNFTNSSNSTNANNQLVFPESAFTLNARFCETTNIPNTQVVGSLGSWPIPAGDDIVMFTTSNLPPVVGSVISVTLLVQLS